MTATDDDGASADPAERPERFAAAYRLLYAPVSGYVLRRVASPEEAAEVVAETFVTLWRRFDEAPAGDALRPWTFAVARKVMANQRRGDRRRSELADRLSGELSRVLHHLPDPADRVADRDHLRSALDSLREQDRELLRLVAWEGLSTEQIATVLGVKVAAVRLRLHRARRRLRRALTAGDDVKRQGGCGQVGDHQEHVRSEIAEGAS